MVSRAELVSLIGHLQTIVVSKPAIPILTNLLLTASSSSIALSVTDLIVSVQVKMSATVLEEGAITLPARCFFSLVRELKTAELCLSCEEKEIVTITAGQSQFHLKGMPRQTFPTFPDLTDGPVFSLECSVLKELLSRSAFAAAREDSRHMLNGILMRIQDHHIICIGADGKRIAKLWSTVDSPPLPQQDFLIPIKAVEEAIKMLDQEGQVTLSLFSDKVGFELDQVTLVSKLLSGTYPDVEKIMVLQPTMAISLHREELGALLRQLILFTTDGNSSVHFTFHVGELTMTVDHHDLGGGTVSMPIDYHGERQEIAFNPHFFHHILRHCRDETVLLSLTNAYTPGVITDSSQAKFVLMPMRLPRCHQEDVDRDES